LSTGSRGLLHTHPSVPISLSPLGLWSTSKTGSDCFQAIDRRYHCNQKLSIDSLTEWWFVYLWKFGSHRPLWRLPYVARPLPLILPVPDQNPRLRHIQLAYFLLWFHLLIHIQ